MQLEICNLKYKHYQVYNENIRNKSAVPGQWVYESFLLVWAGINLGLETENL